MRTLAQRAGLSVKRLHYFNALGFCGWWVNARILRLEEQSPRQIAFFDRWLVPGQSRLERLLPPPFGQSLFAVLRKP